ncbi:MAG: type I-F CRISPR-associated endoribonuclease Cas6/Csy4 [Desulfococcus sp. 4484_241]|nr:MAG: type I-F CRISPR-associated endoribonuclease Cas6/Csy4 [Desulfococcus sp. 4484_241]
MRKYVKLTLLPDDAAGDESDIAKLSIRPAMASLRDYVHITDARPIPAQRVDGYVAYARVRHGHSREKLIRRSIKRRGLSREKAEQDYKNYDRRQFPQYPFVMLRSRSTNSRNYPLYLKKVLLDDPGTGWFNTFGISPASGVENF